jgi:hypothetical protein
MFMVPLEKVSGCVLCLLIKLTRDSVGDVRHRSRYDTLTMAPEKNSAVFTNKNHDLYLEQVDYPTCGDDDWWVAANHIHVRSSNIRTIQHRPDPRNRDMWIRHQILEGRTRWVDRR